MTFILFVNKYLCGRDHIVRGAVVGCDWSDTHTRDTPRKRVAVVSAHAQTSTCRLQGMKTCLRFMSRFIYISAERNKVSSVRYYYAAAAKTLSDCRSASLYTSLPLLSDSYAFMFITNINNYQCYLVSTCAFVTREL